MRLQPLPELQTYEQPVLAHDKVRYVGEPVAVVLAESVALGEDALEAIRPRYRVVAAIADHATAAQNEITLVRRTGTNCSLVFTPAKVTPMRLFDAPLRDGSALDRGGTMGSRWSRAASWRSGMPKRAAHRIRRRQGAVLQSTHPCRSRGSPKPQSNDRE
jgi:CO/xanthine dehydrogenase Mo-binding subunit